MLKGIASCLPSACKYMLHDYSSYSEESDFNNLSLNSDKSAFKELLSEIKELKIINICIYHTLSDNELQFVTKNLDSKNAKIWLSNLDLEVMKLSKCLEILNLCSNFHNILTIELKYKYADLKAESEIISIAKKEFTRKVGIIKKLSIIQKNS